MQALELFAGVGGGSLALKHAGARTIGFCEINALSQAVLKDQMKRGRLDTAPIYPDVTLLSGNAVKKGVPAGLKKRVDIIAGGFPCTGLSVAGQQRGLYGDARSALVEHVYRLVDELKPSYVFLENTPNIVVDPHYDHLLAQLAGRRYECAYVLSTAAQAGAQHVRKRWFLLAKRRGARPFAFKDASQELGRHFSQAVKPTLDFNHGAAKFISFSFGNAVVPAQANRALYRLSQALGHAELLEGQRKWVPTVVRRGLRLQPPDPPEAFEGCAGKGFHVHPPQNPLARPTLPRLSHSFFSRCHPTARTTASTAIQGLSMTARSKHDPGTFLLSSSELPGDSRRIVSDEFWARAMGFPKDWLRRVLRGLT
jgi:site-specific DNA-cytosine methylase